MQSNPSIKRTRSKAPPKGWIRAHRATSFKAAPPGRFRRILRYVFNIWTLSLALVVLLVAFLTASYYWTEFSDRIDRKLLSGDVFTPTAGIYSAPKILRAGEQINMLGVIDYLKTAGYVEKNNHADASRSRYSVEGDVLKIEPGATAIVDGKQVFHSLAVKFAKDGKSVASITDNSTNSTAEQVRLEPKMLSSIAAEGDGRRRTVSFNDLPQHLIKAITVTEDRAFFEHYGVNFRGIARALWHRYESDE